MPSDGADLSERKAAHLSICVDPKAYRVETNNAGYAGVRFVHRSLPELSADDLSTEIEFLGQRVAQPFFVSSMTGGSAGGYEVNKQLAAVAQELRIPVGMGSIRILFRKPDVIDHFLLKKSAPDVPVFANIGGVQLPQMNHDDIFRMVERIGVDGIAIHLNPGQELFQPGGDRDFSGILAAIKRFCDRCPVPAIAKETGFGINPAEVDALFDAGVQYVDLAGAGGTNWVTVETYRHDEMRRLGDDFSDWGTPTALLQAAIGRERSGVVASGGIRTGVEVAKAIALGAEAVGIALPFVRELNAGGIEAALSYGRYLASGLRTAMVLSGSKDIAALRSSSIILDRRLAERAADLRAAVQIDRRENNRG